MIKVKKTRNGDRKVMIEGERSEILSEACFALISIAKQESKTFGIPFEDALQNTIQFCYRNALEYGNPNQSEIKGDKNDDKG